MPPKRRAAPAAPSQKPKKVKISDATEATGKQRSEESHISGRPKRSGPEPVYNFNRPRAPNSQLTKRSTPSRGQPQSKSVEAEPVKRGRGRPRTSETASEPESAKRGPGRPRMSESMVEAEPVKRGRGRPKTSESMDQRESVKKGPGRPKVSQSIAKLASPASKSSPQKNGSGQRLKALSRRFTPVKRQKVSSPLKQQTARQTANRNHTKAFVPSKPTGKRGRSPKNAVRGDTDVGKEMSDTEVETEAAAPAKRGRKPKKNVATTKTIAAPAQEGVDTDMDDVDSHQSEEQPENDQQYWLMKAEPETRLENDVDISYSIDDLLNATEPEGWEGIRNLAGKATNLPVKI
ncbi:MAG: hypothetical protein Q9160_005240 [Pyrenula sp. 1 TL-2023]